MLLFYRLAISAYGLLVTLFSISNPKAKKFKSGRKNWLNKLQDDIGDSDQKIVWIHAASLGEFEQGRPVIEELRKEKPEVKILLTFFSPSGYEVRKNYEFVDWVHYLPLDSPSNARKFVSTVDPNLAIFIKYEFWYYYLLELNRHKVPVIMVSSIFRKNQLFFHWSGAFFKKVFESVNHFFVQDEESKELIGSISKNVSVVGDTRFDRVIQVADQASTFEVLDEFVVGSRCFMIGSSWPSDIKLLKPFIEKHQHEVKFVIAPHNIDKEEIESIESDFQKVIRYSKAKDLEENRILIIDNIGMLSSLYKYADYAYIGGGLRGALHNTVEAAAYGIPIFFGAHDNNQKFREAIELVVYGAAFQISEASQLETIFSSLHQDPDQYREIALKSFDYVRSKSGATDLIMEKIKKLV